MRTTILLVLCAACSFNSNQAASGDGTEDSSGTSAAEPDDGVSATSTSMPSMTVGLDEPDADSTSSASLTSSSAETSGDVTSGDGASIDDGTSSGSGGSSSTTGEAVEPVPYGDCATMGNAICGDGICLHDSVPGEVGVCADSCMSTPQCASSPGGSSPVVCQDVTGDGAGECILDCSSGGSCPPGMGCFAATLCAWPQ